MSTLHNQSISKKLKILSLFLFGSLSAMAEDIFIYPFEPVIVAVPHNTNHLSWAYLGDTVISFPNSLVKTNALRQKDLLGVCNGNSMFTLIDAQTNLFASPGSYQITIEGISKTITVLEPVGLDTNVTAILDDLTLCEIMMNLGNAGINSELKSKAQQIMRISPDGHYSKYAKAYLAVDNMYTELESMYGKPTKPVFSSIGSDIMLLPIPEDNLKWMVLFNKAKAFTFRKDKQKAIETFITLTNTIQYSEWSCLAERFLSKTQ